jgi:hypothetical protein
VQFLFFVLQLVEAVVDTALREKFLVGSLFAEAAFVEDENAVGVLNGAETVGDDECGAAAQQAIKGFANLEFGFGVHAGGGFVKNQEARIVGHGAGKINQLPLPDRECRSAFINRGGDPFG